VYILGLRFLILFCFISFKSQGAFSEFSKVSFTKLAESMELETTRLKIISTLLMSPQTSPSLNNQDWIVFRKNWLSFQNNERTQWRQQDLIILSFAGMDNRLWENLIKNKSFQHMQVYLNRTASPTLTQACQSDKINLRVRFAACIAKYGLENTPAIVSDEVVNFYGGGSSAFSSLIADQAVVFEGYRKDTFNELIQSHEGFHSAMRRLSTLNRMTRLKKWTPAPLAPNQEYDSLLNHHIDRLENMAAPNLGDLFIDERFTSDHHGVIMATIHHGFLQELTTGALQHDQPEEFLTNYPFHYIQAEQSWSDSHTEKHIKDLAIRQQKWLQTDPALLESLGYIETVLEGY